MKPVLYMAPICGITNYIYRNVYSQMFDGYDFALTPFVKNCKVGDIKSNALKDIFVKKNNTRFKLITQVLSKNAKEFITLSNVMFDMGYETVNWNLGCPLIRIRKKMRGAGLLSYPDKVVKFLHEVIPAIPNQLSVKVRLGNEDDYDLFDLLPLLNDLDLKEIIIHPRTGNQMYTGNVDIAAFEKCLTLTKHSVVYNGDINSLETFKYLSKKLPSINKWMIGRGGIINPFLPEQIKNLRIDNNQKKIDRFIEFHDEFFKAYQKELKVPLHIISRMKAMWHYWSKSFEGGYDLLQAVARTRNFEQYISMVEKFFHNKPELAIPTSDCNKHY